MYKKLLITRQPIFEKGRYLNFRGEVGHGGYMFFYRMARMLVQFGLAHNKEKLDAARWYAPSIPEKRTLKPRITWIGHATFLIQMGGINILTDPIFGKPSFLFPRLISPGVSLSNLPPIDVILISHNHWDHMDSTSLLALKPIVNARGGTVLVPQGDQFWFLRRGFDDVRPCVWGQQEKVSVVIGTDKAANPVAGNVVCTFLPAHHWSQRSLFGRNKSLWGSWMIQAQGQTVYFAGDTAYDSHFSEIGSLFPAIDIALLPIGPCEPREWMKDTHMDAREAGQAFLELRAKSMVPMHWGTFAFGEDEAELPLQYLHTWRHDHKESLTGDISVLRVGQMIELPTQSPAPQAQQSSALHSARATRPGPRQE